jgi:hypothetical protein
MRVNKIRNLQTPEGTQRMSSGTTAPTEETAASHVSVGHSDVTKWRPTVGLHGHKLCGWKGHKDDII